MNQVAINYVSLLIFHFFNFVGRCCSGFPVSGGI